MKYNMHMNNKLMSLFDLFLCHGHAQPREPPPRLEAHRQCRQARAHGAAAAYLQSRHETLHPPPKNVLPCDDTVPPGRPVSQSASNMFKTLPFIADFMRHTRHTFIAVSSPSRCLSTLSMRYPSAVERATAAQRTTFLSVFPELTTHRQRHLSLSSPSSSRSLCLPRECRT